jgi:hypothetical protein
MRNRWSKSDYADLCLLVQGVLEDCRPNLLFENKDEMRWLVVAIVEALIGAPLDKKTAGNYL